MNNKVEQEIRVLCAVIESRPHLKTRIHEDTYRGWRQNKTVPRQKVMKRLEVEEPEVINECVFPALFHEEGSLIPNVRCLYPYMNDEQFKDVMRRDDWA